jgi:DNA-binding transcriptional ArsR family regulator
MGQQMIADLFKVNTKDTYASIFTALSEPARIDIVGMIAATDELACTVLDETLPISKSTISYHIKILYHAHLIEVRKSGRYYFYKLRRDVFESHLPGFLERLQRGDRPARRRTPLLLKSRR